MSHDSRQGSNQNRAARDQLREVPNEARGERRKAVARECTRIAGGAEQLETVPRLKRVHPPVGNRQRPAKCEPGADGNHVVRQAGSLFQQLHDHVACQSQGTVEGQGSQILIARGKHGSRPHCHRPLQAACPPQGAPRRHGHTAPCRERATHQQGPTVHGSRSGVRVHSGKPHRAGTRLDQHRTGGIPAGRGSQHRRHVQINARRGCALGDGERRAALPQRRDRHPADGGRGRRRQRVQGGCASKEIEVAARVPADRAARQVDHGTPERLVGGAVHLEHASCQVDGGEGGCTAPITGCVTCAQLERAAPIDGGSAPDRAATSPATRQIEYPSVHNRPPGMGALHAD